MGRFEFEQAMDAFQTVTAPGPGFEPTASTSRPSTIEVEEEDVEMEVPLPEAGMEATEPATGEPDPQRPGLLKRLFRITRNPPSAE
jgi:hypothetical protein